MKKTVSDEKRFIAIATVILVVISIVAYVPFQQWGKTYEADEALQHGTMFPDLDYPFLGGGSHE